MWCELIQRAGESMDFPKSFGESQLVLLPKIENIPHPDQFRPISITNSDYRIVMRYWAKWLMESAREVISLEQNAIFAGRSIDNVVELIHDGFMEAVAKGKDVTILQTDFCKAYDYVNHEALMELLIGLNAPPLFFFFFFEADFIQLVVLNLSHLNYIKLCLFLTSNER